MPVDQLKPTTSITRSDQPPPVPVQPDWITAQRRHIQIVPGSPPPIWVTSHRFGVRPPVAPQPFGLVMAHPQASQLPFTQLPRQMAIQQPLRQGPGGYSAPDRTTTRMELPTQHLSLDRDILPILRAHFKCNGLPEIELAFFEKEMRRANARPYKKLESIYRLRNILSHSDNLNQELEEKLAIAEKMISKSPAKCFGARL